MLVGKNATRPTHQERRSNCQQAGKYSEAEILTFHERRTNQNRKNENNNRQKRSLATKTLVPPQCVQLVALQGHEKSTPGRPGVCVYVRGRQRDYGAPV